MTPQQFGLEVSNIWNGSASRMWGPFEEAYTINDVWFDMAACQLQPSSTFTQFLTFAFVAPVKPIFRPPDLAWPIWPDRVVRSGPSTWVNPHGFNAGGGGIMPGLLFCTIMKSPDPSKHPGSLSRSLFIRLNPVITIPIGGFIGCYTCQNGAQPSDIEVDFILNGAPK